MVKSTVIAYLLIALPALVKAQALPSDSVFLSGVDKNALASYSKLFQSYNQLYSGSEFIKYTSPGDEHPYFLVDEFTAERIQYNGQEYQDVEILYDLEHDDVILFGGKMIKLISERITYFTRLGHVFVRMDQPGMPKGFYDLLYDGEIKVLVKRNKLLFVEKRTDKEVIREFREQNKYYIFKSGMYNAVKSKKSVLQLYGDKKQEIKQYLRQTNILFNQGREEAMVRITEYYSSIVSR
jgi:hypothetical protein